MSLAGKSVIVTGGERGIGLGIVKELLKRGMRVCIAGIDEVAASEALKACQAGDHLFFQHTDVTDEAAVHEAVKATVSAFGRLDAMVANAGLAHAGGQPVEALSLEAWNRVLATNLTGVFLCAKYAFPELRKTKGSMVLMASVHALYSSRDAVAYSASKGGVVALAHALAISGGPDIRVNAISPGWIHCGDHSRLSNKAHAHHPVGRVGRPQDIASLTAFLLSEEAGFITGENFVADGGVRKQMIYRG